MLIDRGPYVCDFAHSYKASGTDIHSYIKVAVKYESVVSKRLSAQFDT